MKVAYLGPKGTFSEEAAFRYYASEQVEWSMCDTILDVLDAVNEGKADKGFVPIENSIEGTITITLDGLIMNNLLITGEGIFPVSLHLITLEGVTIDEIEEVWSIPPALAQCREMTRELKAISRHFNSTASAAEALLESGNRKAAAIASERSAKSLGLQITKENIQDYKENHTRFVEVKNEPMEEIETSKSMLLVTPTEEKPGVLAIILNVFSSLEINLDWIASRPTKKKLGTYRFFIETQKGIHETEMQKAMKILRTFDYDVQILGTYNTTYL